MARSIHGNPPARAKGVCVHCLRERAIRARGLCMTCYDDPGVRATHPIRPSKGYRLGTIPPGGAKAAGRPTEALPGSAEKVEVMAARLRAGEQLFHPGDARHGME